MDVFKHTVVRAMKLNRNRSTGVCPNFLRDLVTDMELHPDNYKHLQFILNRQKHMGLGLGQLYLMVNNDGFGLYRLDDVDYENGAIQLSFTIPENGKKGEMCVDLKNKRPQVFLINWKDIQEIVKNDCLSRNENNNDLLELID
jgi:hypothetical protein